MSSIDYIVMFVYIFGLFVVGGIFSRKIKSPKDMFAAGGESPWWTSGLSAFMTMFSANTFVVWGGIAYEKGFVAVIINFMYGIAALLVGYFVAGKWKKLGIETPSQFIQMRFGKSALHFYTWSMMIFRMVGVAGALYALGKIIVSLMPLPEGHFMQDPNTENLSLIWGIIIFSAIVVIYTMMGGLWAVLMTDVLQFIVLNLAVAFVVPLTLMQAGGIDGFVDKAPEGFFNLTDSDKYTWYFLAGWCAIHFFMIGAEWAFVQRFICVPTAKDARKSTYLFGILYLVSPILWLMPPMIYRTINPAADKEQAYIFACSNVLPAGMLGLMVAAMFSATASMVSSQLNVFSGVLTNDIYRPLKKKITDGELVFAGRGFTILLGIIVMVIALLIPRMGGAENVIVKITELVVVALLAPTLWGLFSRKIRSNAVWVTGILGFSVGLIVRYCFGESRFLTDFESLDAIAQFVQDNGVAMNTFTGVVLPILILAIIQKLSTGTAPEYEEVMRSVKKEEELEASGSKKSSSLPAMIVAWSMIASGLLIGSLVFFSGDENENRQEKYQVRHILLNLDEKADAVEAAKVEARINKAQQLIPLLESGVTTKTATVKFVELVEATSAGKASEGLLEQFEKAVSSNDPNVSVALLANTISEDKFNNQYGKSMGGLLPRLVSRKYDKFGGEFNKQIEALEVGDWSEPFRARRGYHIVKLEAIIPAGPSGQFIMLLFAFIQFGIAAIIFYTSRRGKMNADNLKK